MTWKEFKAAVEKDGQITDDSGIEDIEVRGQDTSWGHIAVHKDLGTGDYWIFVEGAD